MKNRRRKVLINREFQLGLVSNVIIFILIYIVAFGVLAFLVQMLGLKGGISLAEQILAARKFIAYHNYLWIPFVVTVTVMAVHIIYFSHRIAGPIFRFQKQLEAMKRGDFSADINLRKKDFLRDLEGTMNEFILQLREDLARLENIRSCHEIIKDLAQDLRKEGKERESEALSSLSEEIEMSLEKFRIR